MVGEHIWLSLVGPELEERKEWLEIGRKLADIDIVLILGLLFIAEIVVWLSRLFTAKGSVKVLCHIGPGHCPFV